MLLALWLLRWRVGDLLGRLGRSALDGRMAFLRWSGLRSVLAALSWHDGTQNVAGAAGAESAALFWMPDLILGLLLDPLSRCGRFIITGRRVLDRLLLDRLHAGRSRVRAVLRLH